MARPSEEPFKADPTRSAVTADVRDASLSHAKRAEQLNDTPIRQREDSAARDDRREDPHFGVVARPLHTEWDRRIEIRVSSWRTDLRSRSASDHEVRHDVVVLLARRPSTSVSLCELDGWSARG